MNATWTDEELRRVGSAAELQIASRRRDGSLRPYVTIWTVRAGDHLYVRSAYGTGNPWFRRATASGSGRIRAGGIEREMFGLLADQGVGSIPWSPLAKGRLARPWGEETARSDTDDVARWVLPNDDKPIVDAVQKIAGQHGVPMAQVALAWVLRNPVVSAPIVGATRQQHLTDAAAALDVTLSDDEVCALEEHYTPRQPTGY